ncbi:MAG: UDP-N-acetylglucosamine 2-epimerase (non-hydrolyzing) [Planctomycetota bacterium]|nr:UDP-N-acetylglucosamine 2-epimerase (non-hydrolyzing) [Planctomycetota bacterium]
MKVSTILGTRPEAIKLAPVILALERHADFKSHVCVTAQHRDLLDPMLDVFGIRPGTDLNLIRPDQTLANLTSRAVEGIDAYLEEQNPDLVLLQGDTTTVLSGAIACFYRKIPFGHVEAGLRTGDLEAPWPEEANRSFVDRLATLHFAPTESNRRNLSREGIPSERIHVTGNTVVDALHLALERIDAEPPEVLPMEGLGETRPVLITGHRRESFGAGLESICLSIADLAGRFPDVPFVYPVHSNPNVRGPVERILKKDSGRPNIHLIDPLPYLPFVALMKRSRFILTDSGGIQEEAPSLGKPVLVLREKTERPEGVEAGTARLVGVNRDRIVKEASRLLTDDKAVQSMSPSHNPYGDGKATGRILEACLKLFERNRP